MKTDENLFRSAVMGGFNREDVTAYLEKMSAAHGEELAAVRRELEAMESAKTLADTTARDLQETCTRQESRIAELTEALSGAREALEKQRADGEKREKELAAAKKELKQKSGQEEERASELTALKAQVTVLAEVQRALAQKSEALQRAEEELKTLRAEQTALREDAEAYHAVKDRVAGIELEAHQRAQEAEDEAARQVVKTHSAMEAWLIEARETYQSLCAAMDAAVERTRTELDGMAETIGRISDRFAAGETALDQIAEQYHAGAAPAAPEHEEAPAEDEGE